MERPSPDERLDEDKARFVAEEIRGDVLKREDLQIEREVTLPIQREAEREDDRESSSGGHHKAERGPSYRKVSQIDSDIAERDLIIDGRMAKAEEDYDQKKA